MAEGKKMAGAQRGIAFSTFSALIVSVLILIVGAGANANADGGAFKISQLSGIIREQLGEAGVVVFAIGFVAAAISSMLTVPLGAALAANSVFSEVPEKELATIGMDNPNFDDDDGSRKEKAVTGELAEQPSSEGRRLPRWVYLGIMFVMVTIATVVISANGELDLLLHHPHHHTLQLTEVL